MCHADLGVLPCRPSGESGDVIAEEVKEPELVPVLERRFDCRDQDVPVVTAGGGRVQREQPLFAGLAVADGQDALAGVEVAVVQGD